MIQLMTERFSTNGIVFFNQQMTYDTFEWLAVGTDLQQPTSAMIKVKLCGQTLNKVNVHNSCNDLVQVKARESQEKTSSSSFTSLKPLGWFHIRESWFLLQCLKVWFVII